MSPPNRQANKRYLVTFSERLRFAALYHGLNIRSARNPVLHFPAKIARRPRSSLSDGLSQFRSFLGFMLLVAIAVIATYYFLRKSIASQLTQLVNDRVNSALAETGWRFACERVRLEDGVGLKLQQIELFGPGSNRPAMTADSITVHLPTALPDPENWTFRPSLVLLDQSKIKFDVGQCTGPAMQRLLGAICPSRNPSSPLVPFQIHDSEFYLFHQQSHVDGPFVLQNVDLKVHGYIREGQPAIAIEGQCSDGVEGQLAVSFAVDRCAKSFGGSITISRFAFNHRSISSIGLDPTQLMPDLASIAGIGDGTINLAGELASGKVTSWNAEAEVRDTTLVHRKLHLPIHVAVARLKLNPSLLELSDCSGKLGDGRFRVRGSRRLDSASPNWSFSGNWFDCVFGREMLVSWPAFADRILAELNPSGLVDTHFNLGEKDGVEVRELKIDVKQGSFELARFPYPIAHCVGTVSIVGDRCDLAIQALDSGQILDIKGRVDSLTSKPTFEFEFGCAGGLPIDETLLAAICKFPKTQRQIQLLRPTGFFGVHGRFEKPDPNLPPKLDYDIELEQCSMRHQEFDYPIRDISGTVRVRGPDVHFVQLRGSNGNTTITGNGRFLQQSGFQLDIVAADVGLDETLRLALQAATRGVWDSLRPKGRLAEVRVGLTQAIDAARPLIDVDFDLHHPASNVEPRASMSPLAFPYEIKRLRGNVKIRDGQILLTDIEGEHERTWISCQGQGEYDGDGWQVRFRNVLIGSLKIDEDLLAAVPRTLETACRSLCFEGLVNVSGEFVLTGGFAGGEPGEFERAGELPLSFADIGDQPAGPPFSLDWSFRLDMDGARMHVGFDLENVNGTVNLNGSYDGRQASCAGQINLDSLSLFEMQVTNINGPIWIDSQKVAAGYFATPATPGVAPQSVIGQLYSGQIHFDGQTWYEDKQKFYIQTTLANARLEPLGQIWAPNVGRLTGIAQGALRLSGDCESMKSFRGEGFAQLHDAYLFELPVFLAMVKQLSRPDLDSRAFDSSIAEFTVQGDQVLFHRMEFIGDTLSLIGNGWLNGAREIDLNFFTVMGRNRLYVPVLSELAQVSSQQILWIGVDGTLDNPQTHRRIFPTINEGLRRLIGADQNTGPQSPDMNRSPEAAIGNLNLAR